MPGSDCSEHPGAVATFSCDGCARLLCTQCVREGHRLYVCVHCGERALALAPGASSSVTVRQREEKVQRSYSFGEALSYAFRGSGRLMLPGYVFVSLLAIVPGIGNAVQLLVWLLLPGLQFAIVRTTAEGELELPDWPDYSDLFERVKEMFWMILIHLTALAPMALFFYLAGCDLFEYFAGSIETCWVPLVAGLAVGTMVGVFAFGAVGCHTSGWLSFRIDLHLRALLSRAGPDGLRVAGLLTALFLGARLIDVALSGIPLLGAILGATLSGYALFTGAHLVGLIFRRHGPELDPIYRD